MIPVLSEITDTEFYQHWGYLYERNKYEYLIQANMPFVSEYKQIKTNITDVVSITRYSDVLLICKQDGDTTNIYTHGEFKTTDFKAYKTHTSSAYCGVICYENSFSDSGEYILTQQIADKVLIPSQTHESNGLLGRDLHSFIDELLNFHEYNNRPKEGELGGLQTESAGGLKDYRVLTVGPDPSRHYLNDWSDFSTCVILSDNVENPFDSSDAVFEVAEVFVYWWQTSNSSHILQVSTTHFENITETIALLELDVKEYYCYAIERFRHQDYPIDKWGILTKQNDLFVFNRVKMLLMFDKETNERVHHEEVISEVYELGDWKYTTFSNIVSLGRSRVLYYVTATDTNGKNYDIRENPSHYEFYEEQSVEKESFSPGILYADASEECIFDEIPKLNQQILNDQAESPTSIEKVFGDCEDETYFKIGSVEQPLAEDIPIENIFDYTNLAVYIESSDETVIRIDNPSEINSEWSHHYGTPITVGVGTATITLTQPGDSKYNPAETKVFQVNVSKHPCQKCDDEFLNTFQINEGNTSSAVDSLSAEWQRDFGGKLCYATTISDEDPASGVIFDTLVVYIEDETIPIGTITLSGARTNNVLDMEIVYITSQGICLTKSVGSDRFRNNFCLPVDRDCCYEIENTEPVTQNTIKEFATPLITASSFTQSATICTSNTTGGKPFSIRLKIQNEVVGILTSVGQFIDNTIKYKLSDGTCYSGEIQNEECDLTIVD